MFIFEWFGLLGLIVIMIVFLYYVGVVAIAGLVVVGLIAGVLWIGETLSRGDLTGLGVLTFIIACLLGGVIILATKNGRKKKKT